MIPSRAEAEPTASTATLELILRRIRLLARRRIAWLRKLWLEEGERGGELAVTHAEIDTYLEDRDAPEAEASWYETNGYAQEIKAELALVEAQIAADRTSRLARLQQIFQLHPEESDLLQMCLALKLDPALARVYAYLHDHAGRGYATEELALRLFGYGRGSLWRADSALARWNLITEKETAPGEPNQFSVDPFVLQWLLGQAVLDASLSAVARYIAPQPPLPEWPVTEMTTALERLFSDRGRSVNVHISGPAGSGRRTFAAILCRHFGQRLLAVDSARNEHWPTLFVRAQRQALLDNCGLAWSGEPALELPWPQNIPYCPLQFTIGEAGQQPSALSGVVELRIEMPGLRMDTQEQLMRRFVPVSATWPQPALRRLTAQHRLRIGDLQNLAGRRVQTLAETAEAVREASRYQLGKLAQLLECPFRWDDLILSPFLRDTLADFTFEARARRPFWEQEQARNMFPQGRGLVALFSGPPGTGKTMAAQVIAAELGLDLFRIDLSTVVSKYVGETSQNLERILSRAEHLDIVLLFDEADALFGKRTEVKDAHDRFANTDTNYLLQAIENYRGIALLSTNKKENIDTAFIRRLRYVLEFPKPEAEQRERIWLNIAGKLVEPGRLEKLQAPIRQIAQQVEATGAQIKFAVLSALFVAQRDGRALAVKHLIRGLERELMKEGRTLSKREREKLLEHEK